MSWLIDPVALAAICSWTGVAAGIVGVAVAGQGALRWHCEAAGGHLMQVGRRIHAALTRVFPSLRTSAVSGAHVAESSSSARDVRVVGVSAFEWPSDATSVEARLAVLRQWIVNQEASIARISGELQSAVDRLDQKASNELREIRGNHDALVSSLETRELRQTEIDARGLIPLGLSVLLCGVPSYLALVPWVAWLFIALATSATAWAIMGSSQCRV